MRSTATEESTALKRAPARRAAAMQADQLAGAEGQHVVGHESDRDGVPERRGRGEDRPSASRSSRRQRTRRSG